MSDNGAGMGGEAGEPGRFVFPRHPIRIAVLIREGGDWRVCFTKNLSGSGALLELNAAPPAGTLLDGLLSEHALFPFRARVMRLATGGVGVEFVDPSPDFTAAVGRVIAGVTDL